MNYQEAHALMNPGLCPKCEKPLIISSKGFFKKNYSLTCSNCGLSWEDAQVFINEVEKAGIETIRKEPLETWPFEVPIMLKPKEIPHLVRQGVGLHEGRMYSYKGTSSGMSLRIAPGVWLRQGSSGGTVESREVMKLLDAGDLTLTNQRIVFVGDRKTIEIPYDKVIAVDVKEDGLLYIARKDKARIEAFSMMMPNLMKEFILKVFENSFTT